MITSVNIAGFKSIARTEAPLELGAINVFVGANGSGKSNILEAMGFLGAAAAGQITDQNLISRGVRPSKPSLLSSSFKTGVRINADVNLSVVSLVNGEEIKYHVALKYFRRLDDEWGPGWRYISEVLWSASMRLWLTAPECAVAAE